MEGVAQVGIVLHFSSQFSAQKLAQVLPPTFGERGLEFHRNLTTKRDRGMRENAEFSGGNRVDRLVPIIFCLYIDTVVGTTHTPNRPMGSLHMSTLGLVW